MGYRKENRFQSMLHDLSESLATDKNASWQKVQLLYSYCPQIVDNNFIIYPYSLDAIIALGTYYLKSKFRHTDQIIRYLLNLLKGLTSADWQLDNGNSEVPYTERFAFCLNSLLSEVSISVNISSYQTNEISNIFSSIISDLNVGFNDADQEKHFYSVKLPVFLGLAQSMAKYEEQKQPYFCYLFPKHKAYVGIIHHIKGNYESPHINLLSLICKEAGHLGSKTCSHTFTRKCCEFPRESVLNLIKMIHSLLSDEIFRKFEFALSSLEYHPALVTHFYLKNYSEILKCATMLLYRDIICKQPYLTEFANDIKEFVDSVYSSVTTFHLAELATVSNDDIFYQKLKINVLTKVTCLELLSWIVKDAYDAENLCGHATSLLRYKHIDNRILIINTPYTICCLNVLGILADEFPAVSDMCIRALQDFLSSPSSILTNLCKNSCLPSENDMQIQNNRSVPKSAWFEYSIFKKVQNSAIESLCMSLKSTSRIDQTYIPGFLTKFSSLLFMEKGHLHGQYALIIDNVVVSLGHISYSIPEFSLMILQCFQQRLCRHSIESDNAIIHQLGNMLICSPNMEMFLDVLKTFSNMMLEVNIDSRKELECISNNIFHVLVNVGDRLQDQPKIVAIFIRFLEIFVQAGLDDLRSSEVDQGNQTIRVSQENILNMLALLSTKVSYNNEFKKQQERLFQDFWLYFVLSKESLISHCNCNSHLKTVAPKLPTLTSESLTDHDLREFFYMSSLNKIKISTAKQAQLRTQISAFMRNTSDIVLLINKFTFPQIIYLHSVAALEILRIENSEDPNIEPLFSYLTNMKLQKDKYGMWQCICKVVEEVFKGFILAMLHKERNNAREVILERHAQVLLIHFNNIHSHIRHIADKFLAELIDSFPHLLWNRQVLWTMLDILSALNHSLMINVNDQVTSIQVPNSNYRIHLMGTKKAREEIFSDFVARSREIISEARKWAPSIIYSNLQEYVAREECLFSKIDPVSNLQYCAWALLCSNENSYSEISGIISSLIIRSRFIGEVAGIMRKSKSSPDKFGRTLAEGVWKACEAQDLNSYQICLQRATAFAVSQPLLQSEIKQVLAASCIKFFTGNTVSTSVHCWHWLCSAHPNFELEFLSEMFEAWQCTIDNRLGVFSPELKGSDKSKLVKLYDLECPHTSWVEFIVQHISCAKYDCQDKLAMIIQFLYNTLPLSVGSSECVMRRNVESIVVRFSILSSALSLLQSDIPLSCIEWVIVRQRIYCSCLDFFCCLRKFPQKNGWYLQKSIDALVKFWHVLHSDKKHILKNLDVKEFQVKLAFKKENFQPCYQKLNNLFTLQTKSIDALVQNDSFLVDFIKKRKLALSLLAEEITFLTTWRNPCVPGSIDKIVEWQLKYFSSQKSIQDLAKTAWEVSPILAVYLPIHLRQYERVSSEISNMVLKNPTVVSHIPHAVFLLATVENIQKDCKELIHLLTWAETEPLASMNLLSRNFSSNPIVVQYVHKVLLKGDIGTLTFYVPQLVQSLRYDKLGFIYKMLHSLAITSQLFCHQLIWNMKANMGSDSNVQSKTPFTDKLNNLLSDIVSVLSGPEKVFFDREFDFVDKITEVSYKIPRNLKRDERKRACLKALKDIKLYPGCYLPSSPDSLICGLDYNSGSPLQSKARTPFLANFLVYRCSYDKVLKIGMQVSKKQLEGMSCDHISFYKPSWDPKIWQPTIFKAADDVRQDILALQTIQFLKNIFQEIGLDVFLYPYRVVAVAYNMGVIECIPNAHSRDQLGKSTNVCLYDYFVSTFGDEKSIRFQEAQRNFVKSVAAYSLIIFLLQIKDRHNGNIMIDDEGHIIHIDFGFMFESSPGGNLGFEPDMKLTEEMLMIMGGRVDSEPFKWFTELCIKAYLAARYHRDHIVALVTLMLDSGLPCFRGQTIKLLQGRFAPDASDKEAADYIATVIRNSCLNFRTVTYDMLQYLQNSIQY